jgi:hypothetical protein
MESAISFIHQKQKTAVTLLTEYKFSRYKTIEMLFSPDTIAKATAANGIVKPDYMSKNYELNGVCQFMGNLGISYMGCKCLPIRAHKLELQQNVTPLLLYLKEVEKVYLQYEEVKGVLRWLNKNATIGGIRYYWPSIMKVAPKDSVFANMETAPKRFDTPSMLHEWMTALRNSAVTVASMTLQPSDAEPRPFTEMSVSCYKRKVVVSASQLHYETDSMSFNV